MAAPQLEVINRSRTGNNSSDTTSESVFSSVKKFSLERLNDLLRVLMDNMDDTLFNLSDNADNAAQRYMFFESMREVRLKRENIKQSFDYELHLLFDSFLAGGAEADADGDDDDELTLVEFDDLEDNIAVKNMVSKARPLFEDDLFALSERLKVILQREDIDADDNPLDPRAICQSFNTACDLIDADIQVKLVLYKMFEKYVINNLGDLYHEVNCRFIQADVLPEFKAEQERRKQTLRYMANRNENRRSSTRRTRARDDDAVDTAVNKADEAQQLDGINLLDTLQQAIPAKRRQEATAIRNPKTHHSGQTESDPETSASGEFLDTLNRIQAESLPKQPLSRIDPQTQKTETCQQIDELREANQQQAGGMDSQIIEVVSMLFDHFFEDEALPAPIKVLIGRLQVPILKVAILDKEFFNQKSHPARRLLDSISSAALGWSEDQDDQETLIAKIEQIVDFLIKEFNDDIKAFDYVLADFEQFIDREDEKNRRANAALVKRERRKEQRKERARQSVLDLMIKITRGRELNDEVLGFLETTWSKVLFKARLSLGGSSPHWKDLKRISATLVWTLVPKETEAERAKIIQTIPALLRALSKSMGLIRIDTRTQNKIFKMLAQEHARIVEQSSRDVVTRVDDSTVWPEEGATAALARAAEKIASDRARNSGNVELFADDSVTVISAAPTDNVIDDLNSFTAGVKSGKIQIKDEIVLDSDNDEPFEEPVEEINDRAQRWARKLEIGTWVEFKKPGSRALIARLSWRSNVTGNLVFVNRQGAKIKNLTIQTLAAEKRAGHVRTIDSSSAFDRAINTIMGRNRS